MFGRVQLLYILLSGKKLANRPIRVPPPSRGLRHRAVTLLFSARICSPCLCVFVQNHLSVSAVAHPLAHSVGSSVASSAGSGSSSPTALPSLPARAHPLEPLGGAAEPPPGRSKTSPSSPDFSSHLSCIYFRTRGTMLLVGKPPVIWEPHPHPRQQPPGPKMRVEGRGDEGSQRPCLTEGPLTAGSPRGFGD